jgi:hypothetical protein
VSEQHSAPQPSEEELRAALEEQMRRITVLDVLLQTIVTLINLSARRLGIAGPPEEAGEKDIEQAKLGIDAARALLPLLPAEEVAPVRDALSQLQVAYVREVQAAGAPPAAEKPEGGVQSAEEQAPDDAAERAKARSKIWTPPGA